MADFNKAELIYDALYGMESKDDPMLSSIISTAKKLKTAEKTEYDNPEQKKAAIMRQNYQLRILMSAYIEERNPDEDEKYTGVVRCFGMLLNKIREDEEKYGVYNPIDDYLADRKQKIKQNARVKIELPDLVNIDENLKDEDKTREIHLRQAEYKTVVNEANSKVEDEIAAYIFLCELNREYKYADSDEYKNAHPEEAQKWKKEIIELINSDNFTDEAAKFMENSALAREVMQGLQDEGAVEHTFKYNNIGKQDLDKHISTVVNRLTDKMVVDDSGTDAWERAVNSKAIEDKSLKIPPVYEYRKDAFNKDYKDYASKEAARLDKNLATLLVNDQFEIRKNDPDHVIENENQNIKNVKRNEGDFIDLVDDEEDRTELDLSFDEKDKKIDNEEKAGEDVKETIFDKNVRTAKEQGNTVYVPLTGEIARLKKAQKDVWFGSKQYDDILKELIEINKAQNEWDKKALDNNMWKGVTNVSAAEERKLLNRKKDLLIDMKHYILRKTDEKNNSVLENENSKKRRIAMNNVYERLVNNIRLQEKNFNNVFKKNPERYYGEIIHELEHGNKENQDSIRYNKILTKMKDMQNHAENRKPGESMNDKEWIKKEIEVFNEMNEYVSSKYGIVRDKKSEVRQKKNGKLEPVKLGFTFSRSNDDKKKPSEPFSKSELRYKLMLENMERMGTMIMKHMEGGKNNEAIKGLQKQFKAVNDLFGTNIMTESPKLSELVNGQQNIVNDNVIKKADTKIKLNK